jgi:two-component system, NtrC family, response regulator AtoC
MVEDNGCCGEMFAHYLTPGYSFQISTFSTGKDFLDHLQNRPDIFILDFSLSNSNAEELFIIFRNAHPEVPAIIICEPGKVTAVTALLKYGFTDYILKNDAIQDLLWNSLYKITERQKLVKEISSLREDVYNRFKISNNIKGNSPAIQKVFQLVDKASQCNLNISVTGEIGTGKKLVAKTIHQNSARSTKPFVAVKLSNIPHELMTQELFGYEKDPYKNEHSVMHGKLEQANGGTFCIDTISIMDMNLQNKLLQALQENEITRIGGKDKIKLDIRLIITNRTNLADEVDKGILSEDLYLRIMGLPIQLPPLREREYDTLLLAGYFLRKFCEENSLPSMQLGNDAKEKLLSYNYPGNITELKKVIELAAIMCSGGEILSNDILFNARKGTLSFAAEEKSLREYNIQIICHYLQKYNNNVQQVADKLDIGKSTIYKMMQNKEILV